MIGWLRRMMGRRPVVPPVSIPDVGSTQPELDATRSAHRQRIQKADRVIKDFESFDGLITVAIRPRARRPR